MQAKYAVVILVVFGSVVFLTGAAFFFVGQENAFLSKITRSSVSKPSRLPALIAPASTVDQTGQNLHLVATENFPLRDQYLEFLHNSPVLDKDFQVVLSHDEQLADNQYLMDGNVISGFKVDISDPTVTISVYISPKLLNPMKIQYEINSNYLVGVLVASEYQKLLLNPEYEPRYDEARAIVHKIVVQAYDFNEYPFAIRGL